MQERQQTQVHEGTTGSPDTYFDDDDSSGGLVTVLHAPYSEQLPVGEMTVRAIRERFNDRLDIHPQAVAFVDGSSADEDTIVREGQRLMFMRPSGEKGAGR